MKKQSMLVFALILTMPLLAHAQAGCVNSPENPTAVLGLIGSAAAALCALRGRLQRGKRQR